MRHEKYYMRAQFVFAYCILCLAALFMKQSILYGQSHKEQVTIIGAYEPGLKAVQKPVLKPEPSPPITVKPDSTLSGLNIIEPTSPNISALSPLIIQAKEKDNPFSNYLKAGIGSSASPVFLFNHYSKIARQTYFYNQIEHLSSWIAIKDFAPSDWMKNNISTGIDHAFDSHTLTAELFYKRNHHRYYGFRPVDFPDLSVSRDSLAQHYQHMGLKTRLQSTYRDPSMLHHSVELTYSRFNDKFAAYENVVKLDADIRKNIELFPLVDNQSVNLSGYTSFASFGDSIQKTNEIFIGMQPGLALSGSFYSLELALRTEYLHSTKGNIKLYPHLSGRLLLLDDHFEFYAALDGGLKRKNISQIIEYNPFVASGFSSWWEDHKFHFDAGIKTSLIKNLGFRFGIVYDEISNKGFFLTDTTFKLFNHIGMTHDHVQRLQFKSELSFHMAPRWTASAVLLHQQYFTDSIAQAWHEPDFTADFLVRHQWSEQWTFATGLHHESKRPTPVYTSDEIQIHWLKPIWDVHIEAVYSFNDYLSFYALMNNLLHQRYERYFNYPVQGMQVFAGMMIKF
ncbi:MAG: hypothetical protein M0Q41_05575 [Bacteroidales bacterium]|nr:hypothetical protein [Bacteroidales bacterium]